MRMKIKTWYMLIISFLLIMCLFFAIKIKNGNVYSFVNSVKSSYNSIETTNLEKQKIVEDETLIFDAGKHGKSSFRDKKMEINSDFSSNLPIVVIDTYGETVNEHIHWNKELGLYTADEDSYVYTDGSMSIIDNTHGDINVLTDVPVTDVSIEIRQRGNSSVHYDKRQYKIQVVDENGNKVKANMLGMGEDSDWVLNVSFIDKSLIRNYLAYSTCRAIMPYVPDVEYCEVVWKDGEKYYYEGVYLLMESIKVGKNRVDLPSPSENAPNIPVLLRRDRYDSMGLMLENYAQENDLLYGYLDIKWPNKEKLSETAIQRITDHINQFEEALFSEDYETFITYRDMVDMDSFADYLILNEYFISYDAGFNSTYAYWDYSGKITMGPVWDFDGAMDNYRSKDADLDAIAFHASPWFQQMLRDPVFVECIIKRYKELRKTILSDQSIQTFIDETITSLGDAIERDWARWGYFYEHDYLIENRNDGTNRNTKSHEEEIEKIKHSLATHAAFLDEHIDYHYLYVDSSEIVDVESQEEQSDIDWGSVCAAVFIVIFFVAVILVQRMEYIE